MLAACTPGPSADAAQEELSGSVVLPAWQAVSVAAVGAAIERAGNALGWQMLRHSPGRLTARDPAAAVEIEHDNRTYSLRYRRPDEPRVRELDRRIQEELGRL